MKLFGTDGIRAIVNTFPFTPPNLAKLSVAIASCITPRSAHVIIGRDPRNSGLIFESALISGLLACGINVSLAGLTSTPALAHFTAEFKFDLGIMISASHNSYNYNGLKIFNKEGRKISSSEEELIEESFFSLQENYASLNDIGSLSTFSNSNYTAYLKQLFPNLNLRGMYLIIDCAYGSASFFAKELLEQFGAQVNQINDQPNGMNINFSCGALSPLAMAKLAKDTTIDLAAAFDGDADRLVVCDEKGRIIKGEELIFALAKYLDPQPQLIVSSVMSNSALDDHLAQEGVKVIRCGVGDRTVLESMENYNSSLGAENSGHVIFAPNKISDSFITLLKVLEIMQANKLKASELFKIIDFYPCFSTEVPGKERFSASFLSQLEAEHKRDGVKVIIRKSGTEDLVRVLVEAKSSELVDMIARKIMQELKTTSDCLQSLN